LAQKVSTEKHQERQKKTKEGNGPFKVDLMASGIDTSNVGDSLDISTKDRQKNRSNGEGRTALRSP